MYQTKSQNEPPSVGGALSFGMSALPKHIAVLYPALFITQAIGPLLFAFLPVQLAILQIIVSQVLVCLFMAGILTLVNSIAEGQSGDLSVVFSKTNLFLKMFGALWLTGAAVIIGCIFLVIPGIYLALRLAFTPFFVALEGAGPIDAMKMSWEMTDQHVLKLLGFYAAIMAITGLPAAIVGGIVGAIAGAAAGPSLGRSLGQAVAAFIIPVLSSFSMLAVVAMYRMIKGEPVASN